MKDFFNRRQRFSLRKYSIGVCSVLLGTALFAAHGAQADELASTDTPVTPEASVTGDDSSSLVTTSTTATQQTDPTSVVSASAETSASATLDLTPSVTTSADASTGETAKTQAETAKESDESVSESSVENHSDKVSQTDNHENSSDKTQKSSNSDDSNRASRTRRDTSAAASASSTVAVDAQKEVSSWSEFVAALQDSSIKEITVKGNIVAAGDNGNTDNGRSGSVDRKITINTQARPLTIKGENQNASLDLLSNTLELTGAAWELNFKNLKLASANSKGPVDLSKTSGPNTVTFDNVTSVGSSLYGGGGNTNVVIKGNTTSTVSDSYQSGNGQTQFVQRNVGQAGRSDKRRESNIHDAKAVIVSEGASLTLNRSSQGDAITLESGAKVSVQDRANLTINMNTDNATDTARYHNAGIFMADGGTVETGKESKLVLNTSIGQGISLGINRPGDGVTDKDRFGGYGTKNINRKNGPSKVIIGDGATFELNGRDGVMAGNNAEFTTGATSKVRFENKGRGVAIDLGNDSKVNFGKNSTNTFHSVGKGPKSGGGPSGSYDGYNYIGLNENGRIVVDDYATFRVQMDDRGDNAWDDVISLDSTSGRKDQPLFQANKGSIVDIRDDNTNYYAELISVPLGNSSNTFFQFNNPLYVSLLRYTKSDGLSAGEVTGKLPASTPQGNNPEDIGHGNILYISDKSASSGNRVEFNGPTGTLVNSGLGTYTVYSLNKDGRDAQSRNKQSSVWTNIQGGALSIAGFQSNHADINPANAQSVPTGSSTGGISATDRTYGIDPVGDNRQNIWISNGSTINPTAIHKNVIKYVYEDGTPVKDDVIQSSDWNRTLEVAIDQDQFKDVLKNSTVSNGDEFLTAYSKAKYNVGDIDGDGKADTGWRVAGTTNDETVNYTAVTSPTLSGYKAEILSTNVPGLKAGDNADSVAASYTYSPSTAPADTIIETSAGRRTISDTYWRNIVAKSDLGSYETVVVYKKEKQKATIHYVDVSDNNKELASDSVEGDSGANIDYSTANKIQEFVDKGYKLVEDGFTKATADEKKYDNDASVDQEFTVKLEHDKVPVGPNDPHNPTDPINPNDPDSPKYPATDQWKKDVTSTVHYVGAGSQTPNDNVQNAQWTRTLELDKVTGKILNPNEPWVANKTDYASVPTPNVTGYYADKASVPTKKVTQDNLEETVTYKPLGSLVPKPETPNDPNFPSTPGVKYPNDPTDPTKPGKPVVPDVPGYEPHLPDPNDPTKPGQPIQPGTPVTPDKPGEDTPIIYVPKTNDVTQPTKQTVTFEGAGTATPAAKVQNDFTFTGKQKNGTTTWDQTSHTYGKETVPVVEHFYADKKEAGSKTVTPDQPEVTDKVTYKPLGKIIPVDENNTPIPSAPTPQYNNDPQDPTKGGVTPTPEIPGYVTDTPNVTPSNPGTDTPVVYRKADQKAVITYVDQTTGQTLANDQVGGKSGEAINYSTADKIKYYEDRGYVLVSDEFPTGAHFDNDASVDQIWTVTLKHGETPVGPNDPHNPTDPINPNDPNSPKYPATDQWKKDVTSTVHYVGAGSQTPNDNVQNAQWTRTLTLDKVTGATLSSTPWVANKTDYASVPTPNVTGYYADKASVPTKTVTQENLEETVTYKPLGSLVPKPETPNDPNFPSTPGVKYPNDPTDPTKPGKPVVPDVPGYEPHLPDPNDPTKPGQPIQPGTPVTPDKPGEDTPIIYVPKTNDVTQPTKQTVKYTSTDGKAQVPSDKIQNDYTFTGKKNQADGTTTWTENSHTYGRESVPVVSGYYADKSEAGRKTVTPGNPNAEDVVTYKPLGKIIQVDEDGNVIPNSTSVTYNNNPSNPKEAAETKIPDAPTGYVIKEEQPQAWGYNIVDKTIEPNDESDPDRISQDTKIVYVKADQKAVITYVDQTTGQTLANDQVGGKSGEAISYSTADKIKYYEDRGYVLVSDEFPTGAHFDNDASVDQTWTVTLKHGETPVGPNDPHNPTDPINPNDPNSPKYPATDQWKKDVTSTVKYVVSDGKVAAPADHVENATWTRTLTLDKVTGKELSATPWASDKTAYAAVPTPGLTGYYADKASVASKAVTQENLEETVTYKPLGNLVPKPETPNDPNFPSTPGVKYPNDPTDPTKPGQPVVPDVPGYEPHLPDPKDPTKPGQPIQPGTPVTPDKPGEDTPIIYVPKTNDVTQPTKQTVTFEGAGSTTPKDDVQSDYTFTGKKNQADGTTTWTENSHDYGKVKVPVVEHYYADKAEAGGKTVTPEHPEATDKVVYKELGKIIPVDPDGNPIPNAPTPQYTNDPNDPTKGGVTPTPVIPGYVTDIPNVTPSNPGADTPVVYRKADQKAVITYVDQTTGQTLANDQVGGKSGEAINYSTADKIKYYEDRGYVLVSDEFPTGAHFDNDASVDQTWTVTLKHGETPVGPNDPHNPTDPINPNDPNSPKYPATDQWKKDVTSTVKYVVSDGKVAAPADHVENATWTRTLTLDKVTGKELSATPWASDKTAYAEVPTPGLTGYYADKASVASKAVTQENLEETVTYKPLGNLVPKPETPNDPNFPSTPGVKYPNDPTDPTKPGQPVVPDVPGYEPHLPDPKDPTKPGQPIQPGTPVTPDKPGEDTPIIYVPKTNDVTQPTKQTVTFEGAGSTTPKDDVQSDYTFTGKKNQADGTTTWTENSHDYGKVKVPVVEHYYADKAEAGGKTVTPEHPEATDKVVYKELGKIIPVDPDGNPIPNAPTPQYTNDPNDPTKGGVTPTPVIPGYVTDIPNVTPSNPGADTPVVYRKADQKAVITYVDQTTGQTLANDQVGGKSGEAINYSTADKIKYYEDRGYVLVSDEFPTGAHFDNDASVDQTWTVTLKHGETPVGPNDPHNPTDPINPNDPNSPKYPATDQWKKDVTSTVKYVVSDGKVAAPADHVENATWTRTLTLDKVTGKELSATPWASDKTAYAAVPTPGLTGYYADKASVASKAVTQENLEETVTYKPLGNLVPKPETPNDPNFPSTPGVKYPNDPTDPTKPGQPVVPDVPGYKPYLPDPKDPTKPGQPIQPGTPVTPVTPDKPGEDTPIIYVPKTNDVTQPTKQTVTFEGAGSTTPKDDVQSDYTFTGKKNQADGTTTWTENSHDYGKVKVPVVEHYYADKAEAGGKTVTPEHPEATDKVVYKELGKIIPVDPDGNPIPNAPTPQYTNDPNDPTKGGVTPTPVIPGYVTDIPNVTPSNPGADTPVVYRKADQKAVITYVDQTTGQTLANDQVGGKSGEAINYSTADKIKYYEDRGYVLVSDEFPTGAHFDNDASVDQTWTVTLKHGETPVGPNDPHNPTDPINPNDPNSPKYPATDQWKKDVTSTVKYVVSDGKVAAPADHVENATWTRTLTLDKVTGKELSATPWASDKTAYAAVPTPGLTGYYADKASVASKAVTQENLEETVTYKPLGNLVPKPVTPNDPNFPSTPDVKYPNDPTDPTKPGQPVVPDVPGYKPYLPDPNDPTKPGQPIQPGTPVTPEDPGKDTPIIYVPVTPDKPVTPPEQPKVPTPKKPEEPEQPVKPEQPVSPTVIEEVTPQVAQPKEQAVLPETGTENGHIAEVTGLSALITGLGLGLLGRRRKKED